MAQQTLSIGSSANDGTGDPLRTAFTKINANFTELYGSTAEANDLVEDTTPVLGGDLDTAGKDIVGPSNAGKSSLLNYLSRREVAIVSEMAGTTRDVIETHLNIDGYPVIVSDTAGIRDSKDEIEKKGIKLALKKSDDADLNIVLIEPKSGYFAGFLKDLISDKSIFVINKSDLGIDNIVNEFRKYNPIYISLKK